jgi:hypothetical protein
VIGEDKEEEEEEEVVVEEPFPSIIFGETIAASTMKTIEIMIETHRYFQLMLLLLPAVRLALPYLLQG